MEGMASRPTGRSVKISDDERGGWSSDRPRRDGAPARPADLTVHCRVLRPADRLRYSPGSLLIVSGASVEELDALPRAARRGPRGGDVAAQGQGAAGRARGGGGARASGPASCSPPRSRNGSRAGRRSCSRPQGSPPRSASPSCGSPRAERRPRHLILLETARENVAEDDLAPLNELRRALDAGELGNEGIQTALRLGGGSAAEVKRILFRPPPRDDD